MTEHLVQAEAAVRAADPQRALAALTQAVRASANDAKLRIFMAQLLCVLGQWERAHTQLNVIVGLQSDSGPMREMVAHAMRCEKVRVAVFAGQRSPLLFGQPEEWQALLIESLLQHGQGQTQVAHGLADRAFEAAPTVAGRVNGHAFSWIADADSRLGPMLEAMVNGRYYWVPFSRLQRLSIDDPVDLRDRVWLPAQLTFANGGEAVALIPTRYPGSEASSDGQILMAAKTEWQPLGEDRYAGLGQRVLVTDTGEYDLLQVRLIEFDSAPEAGGAALAAD